MKVKIWNAVTDGGDGEHHAHQYPSLESMVSDLNLTNLDHPSNPNGAFDDYDYYVHISTSVFDTTGYEIVEE